MTKKNHLTKFGGSTRWTLLLSACISGVLLFHSCKDDEDLQQSEIETIERTPTLTDTPATFTSLSTYVFAGDYPKSADALLRRISNKATVLDDAVTTAVLTDRQARSMDDATIIEMLKNNRSTLHDKGIDALKISWKPLSSPNVYRTYEYKY